MMKLFNNNSGSKNKATPALNKPKQPASAAPPTPAAARVANPARQASDQAFTFLKGVNTADPLQLYYPRLFLVEQPQQLKEVEAEIARNEEELAGLYERRDDVLNAHSVTAEPNSGVPPFHSSSSRAGIGPTETANGRLEGEE